MQLEIGSTVTLKVRNPMWPRRTSYANYLYIPEFNEYTGTVVRERWYGPDQIGLTSDQPGLKVRVIDTDRIVGMEGDIEKASTDVKTWTMQGSKGATYVVTASRGRYDCTCPGFQFRRACKHVNEIKAEAI